MVLFPKTTIHFFFKIKRMKEMENTNLKSHFRTSGPAETVSWNFCRKWRLLEPKNEHLHVGAWDFYCCTRGRQILDMLVSKCLWNQPFCRNIRKKFLHFLHHPLFKRNQRNTHTYIMHQFLRTRVRHWF